MAGANDASAPAPTPRFESVSAKTEGAALRYSFKRQSGTQGAVELKQALAPAGPLATFEVERIGSTVRVIDGDGSIYAGRVVLIDEDTEVRLGEVESSDKRIQPETQALRKPATPEPAQRFFAPSGKVGGLTDFAFRVTGTNRTTGQLISLEGGMVTDAAATIRARESVTAQISPAPAPSPTAARPPAARPPAAMPAGAFADAANSPVSRQLVGRLRIGASNEIPILALPTAKNGMHHGAPANDWAAR